MAIPPRVPIDDSAPAHLPDAVATDAVDNDSIVDVGVVLRPALGAATLPFHVARLRTQEPQQRRHFSYAEFAAKYAPDASDIEELENFAREHNLEVRDVDPVSGSACLTGRAADVNKAFRISLTHYEGMAPSGERATYRSCAEIPSVPQSMAHLIEGVTGISTVPFATPHFLIGKDSFRPHPGAPAPRPAAAHEGYSAAAVASAYEVPANASGRGQTIAIIELDGGYVKRDIEEYCRQLSLPMPDLTDVSVDGGKNSPSNGGDPASADGESYLDIQVAAAVARGATQRIYFAPNSERSFINAVSRAVKDGATAISISWGAPEALWTKSGMRAFDRVCQAAIAMGIPVFAASGDDGSADGLHNGRSNADYPASSPHVVGCGGTQLHKLDRSLETAWNEMNTGGGATGGAVSDYWPVPSFQKSVQLPPSANDGKKRRTVPDVSANASPSTGYRIYMNGRWYVFGGTSAVSPLMSSMAALLTRRMQSKKPGARIGDFNTLLYDELRHGDALTQIDDGSGNGHHTTGPGYNAVVGLGTPNFAKILRHILNSKHVAPPAATPPRRAVDGLDAA